MKMHNCSTQYIKKCGIAFLAIAAIFFCCNPCLAQKKDTLFGFVGTWKNKTTFIIDSNLFTGTKGGSINITPQNQITISTKGTAGYNKKIDEEIKDAEKSAEQMPATIAKEEGVSQATLAAKIKEQLHLLKEEIKDMKIGNIETGVNSRSTPNTCSAMEAKYNELLSFYTVHQNDKTYNLPPPPEADYFNCWFCEKQKQTDFEKEVTAYADLFAKTERDYTADALRIMSQLQIDLYTGNGNPALAICNVNSHTVTNIFYWLKGRIGRMVKQLFKDHGKNYKVIMPVAKAALIADNFVQQTSDNPNQDILYQAAGLYGKLADTLMKQLKKEKDYTLLAGIPFMIYLDQNLKILLGNGEDMSFFEKLNALGRFKLSVEMDIKMGKDGGYILAHLKGKTTMIYELDSTDCLHIVPAWNENSGSSNWNSISMNVVNLEMITPKGAPPKYIGTKTYRSSFPKLKLNFCKQGTDSIYFQTFNPDPGSDGTWLYVIPNAPPQRVPSGLMGVDRMFMDIDDLQNEAQQMKAPPAVDEAAMKEIQKIAKDMQKNGVTADKMKRIQELTEKSMQPLQEATLPLSNFKFVVSLKNKNEILLDNSFDAKQINPRFADEIVYGYFKIKLEKIP